MDRTVIGEFPADNLFVRGVIRRFQHPDQLDRGLERRRDLVQRRLGDLVRHGVDQGQRAPAQRLRQFFVGRGRLLP